MGCLRTNSVLKTDKMKLERKYVYVFSISPQGLFTPARLLRPRELWRLWWCLYLGKVGFEAEGTDRAGNVEYSIRQVIGLDVKVQRVIRVKVFMYRPIEKAVHNVMNAIGLHSPHLRGCSGWTEIFRVFNVATGILAMLGAYIFLPAFTVFGLHIAVLIGLAVMLAPYPFDMALYVLVLALVEWAGYVVAWWAAWQLSGVIFGLVKL